MIRESFLSRFTPSLLTPETLEAIFVQRHALAARIVERIHESATTDNKHYMLMVGPRGIGKTHLVSLVYHRVRSMFPKDGPLLIAWMREEEWEIASFLDLLLSVLRAIDTEYPDRGISQCREELFSMSAEEAERAAESLLLETIGDRTLLILLENLDEVFEGLGPDGQHKLRALIQNHPCFTLVTTSQSLFGGVSVRESPFYGFFSVEHLRTFSFEEAVDMVARIAELGEGSDDGEELSRQIRSTSGRARVRAVHHLAGGNPRVYMIFSQFLTISSLDHLVEPIMRTLDDLTPYFQARMNHISPQQRKMVTFLCERRNAVRVSEIAQHCFVTHQIAANQLKRLKDMGYVCSEQVGRESYYELREPLMRLSLEVKKQRGEPIRLFIEFLRLWYSLSELNARLARLDKNASSDRAYIEQAIQMKQDEKVDPPIEACLRDFKTHFKQRRYELALQTLEELATLRQHHRDTINRVHCLRMLDRRSEAINLLEALADSAPETADDWIGIGFEFGRLDRFDQALFAADQAISRSPMDSMAYNNRGVYLREFGRENEATHSFEKAIAIQPSNVAEWRGRALALKNLGRYEESVDACQTSLNIDPDQAHEWSQMAACFEKLEDYAAELDALAKAIDLDPFDTSLQCRQVGCLDRQWMFAVAVKTMQTVANQNETDAWLRGNLAIAQYRAGHIEESLESLDHALILEPSESWFHSNRGVALGALKRYDESITAFDDAIKLGNAGFHTRSNRATILFHLGRWNEGRDEFNRLLSEFVADGAKSDTGEVELVGNLLIRTQNPVAWKDVIRTWITLFKKHQVLEVLGHGVVRSIRILTIDWISVDDAQNWNQCWQDLGQDYPDLQLPLRLLDAAVSYLVSPDKRILLRLPQEERAVLKPLIDRLVNSE